MTAIYTSPTPTYPLSHPREQKEMIGRNRSDGCIQFIVDSNVYFTGDNYTLLKRFKKCGNEPTNCVELHLY